MRRTRASAARARRARPLRASAIRPCCATPPVTPPEWLLERQFITAGGIVELHVFRVELLWIKPTTEPLKSALVLLAGGGLDHGQDILIAFDAATVFGRACSGTADAQWILLPRLPRQDRLKSQVVFPTVAEVVVVSRDGTRPGKVMGDGDFPAGHYGLVALECVVIRDTNLHDLPVTGLVTRKRCRW